MHMINLYILIHCCVYLFYSKLFYSLSINQILQIISQIKSLTKGK